MFEDGVKMAICVEEIFSMLPDGIFREMKRLCFSRRGGMDRVGEIHLSVGRGSSFLWGGERIFLSSSISLDEMRKTVESLCGGALYAHRESLSDGYISLEGGVRVGVCGRARYEGGRLVGVSEITSLLFRIPTVRSSACEELLSAWRTSECGMLIYAPPCGGKTTALRTLVSEIASKDKRCRVAVVDERCEFIQEECMRLGVDLFRGYKRGDGLEIALRTMSPEVLVIDEIGARRESETLIDSLNSGVRLLASAHASSRDQLMRRVSLFPFFEHKIFDVIVGIFNTDGVYSLKTEKIC